MKDKIQYEIVGESADDVLVRCTISSIKRKGTSRTRIKFPEVLRWLIKQGYSNICYNGDYNLAAICEEPKTFTFSKTPSVVIPYVYIPMKELKKMDATKYSIITKTEILGEKKKEEAVVEVTEIITQEQKEEEPTGIVNDVADDAPFIIPVHHYHDDESVQERKPKKKKNKKNEKPLIMYPQEESDDFEN